MREVDLYEPVRDWLQANGYQVHSEVEHCDIAARRGQELILIELKCRFGTELLVQAVDRQSRTESVYVAVPRPPCGGGSPRWKGIRRLLRRLELGLLFCRTDTLPKSVEVVLHPLPSQRRKIKKLGAAILQEMEGRSGDYNTGGSSKRKLVTAYRESALRVACFLEQTGPTTPRRLRQLGTGPKTLAILSRNVYGWFERVGHGTYALTSSGLADLGQYSELREKFRTELAGETPA